jgi:hypothetical protein
MTKFRPPSYRIFEQERARECQTVCRSAYSKLIAEAVALGWREQEIALELADAADDYVFYLGAKPRQSIVAANANKLPLR